MTTRRDWSDCEWKRETGCRVGHHIGYDECAGDVELAHLAPRRFDAPWDAESAAMGFKTRYDLYVEPNNIIPLCKKHHEAFDAHRLSVVEFLTPEEQGHVANVLGLVRALKRVGGEQ